MVTTETKPAKMARALLAGVERSHARQSVGTPLENRRSGERRDEKEDSDAGNTRTL